MDFNSEVILYAEIPAKRTKMSNVCLCVCVSHAGIVSQELIRRWDSERERFTTTSYM